jgi:chorismate synthase
VHHSLICHLNYYNVTSYMSSSFGKLFKISTWGESHGVGIGVVVEGCPAGLELQEADIQAVLNRRRPGQNSFVSERQESDTVAILSGVNAGKTLGTPISLVVANKDARSADYEKLRGVCRPSHADYTYWKKYGINSLSGGGRSSARETIGRVAAGAIAQKILSAALGVCIRGYVESIGGICMKPQEAWPTVEAIEASPVRCPDPESSRDMCLSIEKAKQEGDSVGGIIRCLVKNVPAGLGEPVFDKLEADLAKAMLSLPATKGFEIGSGFKAATMKGSEHNDAMSYQDEEIVFKTNYSGGVQGGISNGQEINFRIAFKPPATIAQAQTSVRIDKKENVVVEGTGRHDPCVVPRAVPIVEAMAALVLVDHWLRYRATAGFI